MTTHPHYECTKLHPIVGQPQTINLKNMSKMQVQMQQLQREKLAHHMDETWDETKNVNANTIKQLIVDFFPRPNTKFSPHYIHKIYVFYEPCKKVVLKNISIICLLFNFKVLQLFFKTLPLIGKPSKNFPYFPKPIHPTRLVSKKNKKIT